MSTVLVTGGSGFIAGHCILQLVEQGHAVRATVRNLSREQAVRKSLTKAGLTSSDALGFIAADLLQDEGWAVAMRDVEYVLHVVPPFAPRACRERGRRDRPRPRGDAARAARRPTGRRAPRRDDVRLPLCRLVAPARRARPHRG